MWEKESELWDKKLPFLIFYFMAKYIYIFFKVGLIVTFYVNAHPIVNMKVPV